MEAALEGERGNVGKTKSVSLVVKLLCRSSLLSPERDILTKAAFLCKCKPPHKTVTSVLFLELLSRLFLRASLVAQLVKHQPAMQETPV